MLKKITENHEVDESEAVATAKMIALAAIKYGDLSNQASKDYIFDIDRFTSVEGDTGPYILYTMVRIKSILNKYVAAGGNADAATLQVPTGKDEKDLMLCISRFNAMMKGAYEDIAPHKVCAYIYEMANAFNHFYHGTKILVEEDEVKKAGYIALLKLTLGILEDCIDVLGFEAPERM
jgi:arginyl-tRNA synthetase